MEQPNKPKFPLITKRKYKEKTANKKVDEMHEYYQDVSALPIEQQIELLEDEYSKEVELEIQRASLENAKKKLFGRNVVLKEKVMHMFLTGKYTQRQIAKSLNVSAATVSRILCEPQIREAIEEYQREEDFIVTSALKALRWKALDKTAELISNSENEMVSAVLIRDVLDRTGHKPVEKKEIKMEMTYEERLQELAKGVIVEADYKVIDDNEEQTNTGEGEHGDTTDVEED